MENQAKTNANLAAVKKRILAEIAAIQTDAKGVFSAQTWADFGALGSRLAKAGVAWKTCGVSGNFTSFMEKAFCDEAERGVIELRLNKAGKSPNSRVRLKKAPSPAAAKKPSTSANAVSPSQPKKPSTSANAVSSSQPKEPSTSANAVSPSQPKEPSTSASAVSPSQPKEPSTSADAVSPSQPKESSTSASAVSPSQPKKLSDAELKKRVLAELAALQTNSAGRRDPNAWVNFIVLVPRLKAKGVDCKAFGCMSYAKLLESRFADSLQFDKSKTDARRVRPKTMETGTRQTSVPAPVAAAPSVPAPVATAPSVPAPVAVAPTVPAPIAVAPTVPAPVAAAPSVPAPVATAPTVPAPVAAAPSVPAPAAPSQAATLSDAELKERVFEAIQKEQTDKAGVCDPTKWVYFSNLGSRLRQEGVDCKALGCASYAKLLESRFADSLQFDKIQPNAYRVRPKTQETETRQLSVSSPSQAATLSDAELKERVFEAIRKEQTDKAGVCDPTKWVYFSNLGSRLRQEGVDCGAFGRASYVKLLESRFADSLQFDKSEPTAYLVRPTLIPDKNDASIPDKNDASLADWAIVDQEQIGKLAALALPEKWSFQNAESTRDSRFPILESYLKYTFRQLAFEGKVQIAKDVAAFNVGLFTRQYDPIFAFFRQNKGCNAQPWRLSSFAVGGENADGKELIMRFRPLPKRARYFDRREDFVFDDEAEIYCDAEHCLVERAYRLPNKFLRRYCSPKFLELEIDGETRTFDEIADKPEKDAARLQYFEALAKKLPRSNELVLMNAAFNAAVEQAKKRVAANFRTAVPAFNPMKRKVYFCLPLALGDPASNRPDVALVVQWIAETGVYQGHTIYTLEMAYQCARLTARLGDENWLDGEMGKI